MDQTEEIKAKVDIIELVSGYTQLKQAGRNWKGLCPFHQEKSPSFMVNPELGIYKCFGCSKGGDAISFIEEIEGVDFKEARQILADRVGIKLVNSYREKSGVKDEMLSAHEMAISYYHYLLTQHKVGEKAREYLKGRGVNEKIIETFKIGFALPSWDGLTKYLIAKKGYKAELLERAGLVVRGNQGKYYDRFRDRIVFPLIDNQGRTVGLSGRLMPGADEKAGAKYINSPETEIYHKSRMLFGLYQAKKAIREKDRVILVEGEMDMISSYMAGVGETVAVKGTALTEEQVLMLSRLTKNLILALDADSAGQMATRRSIELAEKQGMYIRVVKIEGGKDPDDIARDSASTWKKMIEGAIDVYDFYLESAVKRYGVETVEGKRKISEEVAPLLTKIENEVIKAHFTKKLATVLDTEVDNVAAMMRRVGISEFSKQSSDLRVEKQDIRDETKKEENAGTVEILSLVFRLERNKAKKVVERILKMGVNGGMRKILEIWLKKEEELIPFIKGLPAELRGLAEEAYLLEPDEERMERDLEEVVLEWEKRRRKERLEELRKQIVEAEKEGNEEKIRELQEKVANLSKKLAV